MVGEGLNGGGALLAGLSLLFEPSIVLLFSFFFFLAYSGGLAARASAAHRLLYLFFCLDISLGVSFSSRNF